MSYLFNKEQKKLKNLNSLHNNLDLNLTNNNNNNNNRNKNNSNL